MSRVSGVKSISSTSSFGRSRVTVEFSDDVDIDTAASDMRDALGTITNDLPEDAEPRVSSRRTRTRSPLFGSR